MNLQSLKISGHWSFRKQFMQSTYLSTPTIFNMIPQMKSLQFISLPNAMKFKDFQATRKIVQDLAKRKNPVYLDFDEEPMWVVCVYYAYFTFFFRTCHLERHIARKRLQITSISNRVSFHDFGINILCLQLYLEILFYWFNYMLLRVVLSKRKRSSSKRKCCEFWLCYQP